MSIVVSKFGGTSMGNYEAMARAAAISIERNSSIVCVSATSGTTDKLIEIARCASTGKMDECEKAVYSVKERHSGLLNEIKANGEVEGQLNGLYTELDLLVQNLSLLKELTPRAYDHILSLGERMSSLIFRQVLKSLWPNREVHLLDARTVIKTDSNFGKGTPLIEEIEKQAKARLQLDGKNVYVTQGFIGSDLQGNTTILGRGGSDLSAVALAKAIKADVCEIYTDVDGVYTTDPRVEPKARRLERITFEEMLEMASLGSKVLQIRSVEFAGRYNVPLRVLSSFQEGAGTLISYEDDSMEKPLISGIAFNRDEAKLTMLGVPDRPGIASRILGPVAAANIEVDMIVQNVSEDGTTNFTFTVNRGDYARALSILGTISAELGAREVLGDDSIVKVSIVGVGMRSHAGIAAKMFDTLAAEGINIQMISTSEIKISVVLNEKYLELAVRSLHEAFELDKAAVSG